MVKILLLDIETKPNLAYVWRFWKENIQPKQVVESTEMYSWAAKWLGEEKVLYEDTRLFNEKSILKNLVELLDEADIVIAHNAERFDLPYILSRCAVHRIMPPSPYKVVDTLKVAKREFRFPSNSLEYLCKTLKLPHRKLEHKKYPGFELWLGIMNDEEAAWEENKAYNIGDVTSLEDLYIVMRPFIRNHPNLGILMEEDRPVCPKCGSHHLHYRGYATTNVGKYRRLVCLDCGGWSRTRYTELDKEKRKQLVVNAVQ